MGMRRSQEGVSVGRLGLDVCRRRTEPAVVTREKIHRSGLLFVFFKVILGLT